MRILSGVAAAAFVTGGLLAQTGGAQAQTVVASWIQYGPASSNPTPTNYGDLKPTAGNPASLVPTILARSVITGGSCPSVTLDHAGAPIAMNARFDASTLTSGLDKTFSIYTDYPTGFVDATATAGTFANGFPKATTASTVCEAIIPAGHTVATINGTDLKLPVANPKRILVIGDTGCRLNSSKGGAPSQSVLSTDASVTAGAQQNCNDPASFPFKALADYEAQFKPDLILHVGDYFYRDSNCVKSGVETAAGCTNPASAAYMPWGDTFDSWNADVFIPGKNLLAAAPWVMVRGNHESCGRGARGWFAMMDPRPYFEPWVKCRKNAGNAAVGASASTSRAEFAPTYVVPAGNAYILAHDSSFANDASVDVNMAKNFDFDLTAVLNALPANAYSIYATHKPVYGYVAPTLNDAGDFTEQYTMSGAPTGVASAFTGGVPAKLALMLSGHVHQFEYLNFQDYTHFAPQMVVGVGGDNLDPTANPNGTTATYKPTNGSSFKVHNNATTSTTTTTTVQSGYAQALFGFAVLDATPTGFVANVYNTTATKAGRCTITLNPRNIACWQ